MTTTPPETLGYDPAFLAVGVPLPTRPDPTGLVELGYVHFTVLLDTTRRLAATTAVNVDGAQLVDVERGDDWQLDDRVGADEQTGPALYAGNDLDRGHLVRRRDPVWGSRQVAERANADTFAFPNAAPQAAGFNQGMQLWLGLEDYVLAYARTNELKVSVFTGPVLAPEDPLYRGVRIPRRFYKVVAWTSTAPASDDVDEAASPPPPDLACTAYVLDQTPQLDDLDVRTRLAVDAGEVPPLGPFRTFQVPVADVAGLTGLDLGPLTAADRLRPAPAGVRPRAAAGGWLLLGSVTDIVL